MEQAYLLALNLAELNYLNNILEGIPNLVCLSKEQQNLNAVLLAEVKEGLLATS